MYWLVIVALWISSTAPSTAWTQDQASLDAKMETVNDAPVEPQQAEIPATPTTVALPEALPFIPKDPSRGWGELLWDNSNAIAGGTLITYLGGQAGIWLLHNQYKDAARSVERQLKDAFPNGVDKRLKPQMDKIAEIEKSIGEKIGEIQNPDARRTLIDEFGSEVCATHLARLGKNAQMVESNRRYGERLGRWWSGGKYTPAPTTKQTSPVDDAVDAEMQKAIDADRGRLRDAYEEWYKEVEKLQPEFARITNKNFTMPPSPAQMMRTEGSLDQRAMRDAIADLNAILSSTEGHTLANARRTWLEGLTRGVGDSVKLGREQGGQAVVSSTAKAGLKALGSGIYKAGATAGHVTKALGSGIYNAGGAAGQIIAHPFQSVKFGAYSLGNGTHSLLTNAKFLIRRAPEFTAAMAFLWISGSVMVNEIKLKTRFQNELQGMVAAQRNDELTAHIKNIRRVESELLILATTQSWKVLASEKKIEQTRENGPFILKQPGSPLDSSPAAAQEMRNLVNASGDTEKALGIGSFEALWVKLYQKHEHDPRVEIKGTQVERDKSTYEKHKESIQKLALATGSFSNNSSEALDNAYNLMKQQIVIRDQEEAARVKAAGTPAVPPAAGTPASSTTTPAAPATPAGKGPPMLKAPAENPALPTTSAEPKKP
jgi:hypothetical protein